MKYASFHQGKLTLFLHLRASRTCGVPIACSLGAYSGCGCAVGRRKTAHEPIRLKRDIPVLPFGADDRT
jgi:hypothetical protein